MSSGKRKKRGILKYVILILFLLIMLFGVTSYFYIQNLGFAYKPGSELYYHVEIPEGTTASGISKILEENNVVRFGHEFNVFSRIHRLSSKYQAGSYALSPGMTMKEIADILSSGKVNDIEVTIPEGYTEYDVADLLASKGIVSKKKFVKTLESGKFASDYPFLKSAKSKEHMLEGFLFPKTYKIPASATNDEIIRMMLDEYKKVFVGSIRAGAKKLKRSEFEIVTIASIIEKECGVTEDQSTVSSVIYNRLRKKMALQMDSTIQYILGLEGERKKDLSNDDTQVVSPYNTYINKGIPEGPICSPGKSALLAATHPENTKYLYFVLSDKLDNTMKFSVKYSDFLKDKDAYYAAEEAAGNY